VSEWRDMERRHALMQIQKMEVAASGSRQVSYRLRCNIRSYQRKMHLHEWHLAMGELPEWDAESRRRAVKQLGGMIDFNRRSLQVSEAAERQAQANLAALRKQMTKLDRWDRWADRIEEFFWPVTILRAIWAGHATRNNYDLLD
jgi:hypothetical protein